MGAEFVSVRIGGREWSAFTSMEATAAFDEGCRTFKLEIAPDTLAQMGYSGYPLHKISSKCGIFAEADANTLLKAGVPVEEIIASLFEAVVYQNLATLTRGNTPLP